MEIAEDLLTLAGRLANPAPDEPEQASLRRSVSTAYYAPFNFLVHEAVQRWNGTDAVRAGLERRFEHSFPSCGTLHGCFCFCRRPGTADYDNAKEWTRVEAREKVAEVLRVFQNWRKIRTHPAANEYLLSLLIGNKRD